MSQENLAENKETENLPRGAFKPVAENWCHSMSHIVKVDFEWVIHHFEFQDPNTTTLTSVSFSSEDNPDFKWKLSLRPADMHLTLFLNESTSIRLIHPARVKFAIVNKRREKVFPLENYLPINTLLPKVFVIFSREILFRAADDLLPNGDLTIYCVVEYLMVKPSVSGQANYVHDQPLNDQLAKDFEGLFESMKFSDVTLSVGGLQFRAHKSILSARSPVFAAMFEHPTKEKLTDFVDIPDTETEAFQEVLRYIYTGRVSSTRMEEMPDRLMAAADKYLLVKLKQECENHLINKVSTDNCIEYFFLADHHSAENLMLHAYDLVRRFPAEVMATRGWKNAKKSQPKLVCNLQEMLLNFSTLKLPTPVQNNENYKFIIASSENS